MTVLTQLSVGAFATIWLLQMFGQQARLNIAALVSLMVGGLALGASTMHLGRPIHAYRALKMWKRSWLSREVLLFGCFSQISFLYAGLLWLTFPGSKVVGALTSFAGIAGVTASACIYLVPATAGLEQQTHPGRVLSDGSASWAVAGCKHWVRCAPLADDADRHGGRSAVAESCVEISLAGELRYV